MDYSNPLVSSLRLLFERNYASKGKMVEIAWFDGRFLGYDGQMCRLGG